MNGKLGITQEWMYTVKISKSSYNPLIYLETLIAWYFSSVMIGRIWLEE